MLSKREVQKMANEKRLIDVSKTINHIQRHIDENVEQKNPVSCFVLGFIIKCLEQEPTVDAVEVVHGRWEPRTDAIGFVRCSVCHDCNVYDDWVDGKRWAYCPNCGAKMRGSEE
jgi:hypothetical protein